MFLFFSMIVIILLLIVIKIICRWKPPVMHYANANTTSCGVYLAVYQHPLPLHTTIKEKVTCKKCRKFIMP